MTWDNEHTRILFKNIEDINAKLVYLTEVIGETQDNISEQLVRIENAILSISEE